MRHLLIKSALLLSLFALPAWASPQMQLIGPAVQIMPSHWLVQGCENYQGSGATQTCTFSSPIAPGDTIYTCAQAQTSAGNAFSGDGDTWILDPNAKPFYQPNIPTWITCAYVTNTVGGGNSITATNVYSSGGSAFVAMEIHGTSVLDQEDAGVTANVASATTGSITPTVDHAFVIAFSWNYSTDHAVVGTNVPWTLPASAQAIPTGGSGQSEAMEYYVQPTAASVAGTFSYTPSHWWSYVHIVDFR